jgi:hypothetical protein
MHLLFVAAFCHPTSKIKSQRTCFGVIVEQERKAPGVNAPLAPRCRQHLSPCMGEWYVLQPCCLHQVSLQRCCLHKDLACIQYCCEAQAATAAVHDLCLRCCLKTAVLDGIYNLSTRCESVSRQGCCIPPSFQLSYGIVACCCTALFCVLMRAALAWVVECHALLLCIWCPPLLVWHTAGPHRCMRGLMVRTRTL